MRVQVDHEPDYREVGRIGDPILDRALYYERLAAAALFNLQAFSKTAYNEIIERAKEWK